MKDKTRDRRERQVTRDVLGEYLKTMEYLNYEGDIGMEEPVSKNGQAREVTIDIKEIFIQYS